MLAFVRRTARSLLHATAPAVGLVRARLTRDTSSDLLIRRFLDLSTGHLREPTCRDLDNYEGITAYDTRHGWLMYAPAEGIDELATEGDWPAELLPIVTLAREHGCDYILFDGDAQTTELLPTFDW